MADNRYDRIIEAGIRVGREPLKQLAWLIELANAGADDFLESGKLANAAAEVGYFTLATWPSSKAQRSLTLVDVTTFAAIVREGIDALLDHRPWRLNLAITAAGTLVFSRTFRAAGDGTVEARYESNDQLAIARWRAQELIADKLSVVGKCRRTACGKLFVVFKRQEYCSSQCSQIERTTRWRKNNPDESSKLRHAAYQRKVAREKGPAVAKLIVRRTTNKGEASK
jgi:hypothetical protein